MTIIGNGCHLATLIRKHTHTQGDLYSVKIMWPRTAEERARNRLTGFVCFMDRQDAEDAMATCSDQDPFRVGRRLWLRWGKSVRKEDVVGLAPIPRSSSSRRPRSDSHVDKEISEADLARAIRVVPPTDPRREAILSKTASIVARDGTVAEQHILISEPDNPDFRFLLYNADMSAFEKRDHVYYKWRVYAFAHGEVRGEWRTEPFRMFRGGRVWIPPHPSSVASAEESASAATEVNTKALKAMRRMRDRGRRGGADGQEKLTEKELTTFQELTRTKLCASREAICAAMAFCLEHGAACGQICTLLRELTLDDKCSVDTRIARLYLLSDILFNSQQPGVKNAFRYRDAIEKMVPDIFTSLGQHRSTKTLGRMTQHKLTSAVLAVLGAWSDWGVYNSILLDELDARFHGREIKKPEEPTTVPLLPTDGKAAENPVTEQDLPPPVILNKPLSSWTDVVDEDNDNNNNNKDIETTNENDDDDNEEKKVVKKKKKKIKKESATVAKTIDAQSDNASLALLPSDREQVRGEESLVTDVDNDIDGESLQPDDLDEEGWRTIEEFHRGLHTNPDSHQVSVEDNNRVQNEQSNPTEP